MAPCQSRQLVICSLPLAVLVAFFWYRRRRSLSRSDPGGTPTPVNQTTFDKSSDNNQIHLKSSGSKDLKVFTPVKNLFVLAAEESCAIEECLVKKEEFKQEAVQPVVEIVEVIKQTESLPAVKDIEIQIKEVTCVESPVQPKEQTADFAKVDSNIDLKADSVIFHSTVIEEEKDIDQLDSLVEEKVGEISENSVDKEENSENSGSLVLQIEDSVQNNKVHDTKVECNIEHNISTQSNTHVKEEPIKKKEIIHFEEKNNIGNSALRKYKKAAKKAEKKSKRQEKSLKLSSLFFKKSENPTSSLKEDSFKSKEQKEGDNTSSDSGIPSSEDSSTSMAQGQKTDEKTNNSTAGLEQKLASLGLDTTHSAAQRAERDSANHSPAEVMLNSPAISTYSDAHSEGSSDSGKGCSDVVTPPSRTPAGGSSVAGDQVPSIYEFVLPQVIVGRLIGRHGSFLQDIRSKTHTNVFIKRHPETNTLKICAIEGTQQDIDAALKMIRQKFPLRRFPDLTLERVSFVKSPCLPINPENLQLHLVEGVNNDVILSSLITAGHFFLQLPSHMSYQSLYHLQNLMNSVYNSQESPCLHEPQPDVVCVAPTLGGGWYRAQILSVDKDTDTSYVKFLDYGGYLTVENAALRQIRGDFLLLPFQAVECVLANVVPPGGEEEWSEEATKFVHQMTTQQTLQAQVYDYTETGQPLVYLYCTHFFYSTELGVLESKVVLLNQELVSRGFADLIEFSEEDNQDHQIDSPIESS